MRALLLLLALGCGGVSRLPPTGECGPSNCQGCCSGGSCVGGTSNFQCGTGGNACLSCGQGRLCLDQACGVEPMPAGAKLVFVTRTTYTGELGGISGADGLCAAAASAGTLPGRFKAWLSVNGSAMTVNASARLTSDGPWYLPGVDEAGKRMLVFTNRASLRATPRVPIDRTELLEKLAFGRNVWTGTTATGLASSSSFSQSCSGWSSSTADGIVGTVYGSDGSWTEHGVDSCSRRLSLYCFED